MAKLRTEDFYNLFHKRKRQERITNELYPCIYWTICNYIANSRDFIETEKLYASIKITDPFAERFGTEENQIKILREILNSKP